MRLHGLNEVAEASKHGNVPLYYNPFDRRVSITKDNKDYDQLTVLIRENTPEEIEESVRYFMSL